MASDYRDREQNDIAGDEPADRARLQLRDVGQRDSMKRTTEKENLRRLLGALLRFHPLLPDDCSLVTASQDLGLILTDLLDEKFGVLLLELLGELRRYAALLRRGSPQPTGRIMQQKTKTIKVANCRIARGLVVRDEITESSPSVVRTAGAACRG